MSDANRQAGTPLEVAAAEYKAARAAWETSFFEVSKAGTAVAEAQLRYREAVSNKERMDKVMAAAERELLAAASKSV